MANFKRFKCHFECPKEQHRLSDDHCVTEETSFILERKQLATDSPRLSSSPTNPSWRVGAETTDTTETLPSGSTPGDPEDWLVKLGGANNKGRAGNPTRRPNHKVKNKFLDSWLPSRMCYSSLQDFIGVCCAFYISDVMWEIYIYLMIHIDMGISGKVVDYVVFYLKTPLTVILCIILMLCGTYRKGPCLDTALHLHLILILLNFASIFVTAFRQTTPYVVLTVIRSVATLVLALGTWTTYSFKWRLEFAPESLAAKDIAYAGKVLIPDYQSSGVYYTLET